MRLSKDYKILFGFLLLAACHLHASAQSAEDKLREIVSANDSTNVRYASEKLYLQSDKPYYALGDTIWFKAYLLNTPTFLLSSKSRLLHLDITSDSGKLVKEYLFTIQAGFSWGNIALGKEFRQGSYIIRAWTNWMRNFGPETFFYKTIRVTGNDENAWLIDNKTKLNGQTIYTQVRFMDMNKSALTNNELQLALMIGDKTPIRQKVKTDANGLLDVNFTAPSKPGSLAIIATNASNDKKAVIPIALNRLQNTDIQFLPEGGNLVAGLDIKIGVKAIGDDGRGINISGAILDHNQQQVASFATIHKGMGSFDLLPQAGESYSAKVSFADGTSKTYPLPAVKSSGTALQVINDPKNEILQVSLSASNDLTLQDSSYYLVGKARGLICYAAILSFKGHKLIKHDITKNLFPSGIVHFILMRTGGEPLNERLVYIDHHDNLRVDIQSVEDEYAPKDSIAMQLQVTNALGEPVAGNFSLAVTDDSQIKSDTSEETIISRMHLTSELKGYVEDPSYYLAENIESRKALDNLLLTQGWISYQSKPAINYPPEMEYTVNGRAINMFNKGVRKTHVLLFSKSPSILMDTLTDAKGDFTFHNFPRVDTPIFLLKAVNRQGRSFNIGITVNDNPPPVFQPPHIPTPAPWYVNSDSTMMNYVKDNISSQKEHEYTPDGKHRLKGVVIKARKVIKNSQNLNGSGNADLVIDEKELEQAGKKTWLQLFEEKITGFREAALRTVTHTDAMVGQSLMMDFVKGLTAEHYFIKDRPVVFIIDGVELDSLASLYNIVDLRYFLSSHNAEDIKGIELHLTGKYINKYETRYPPDTRLYGLSYYGYNYMEITTRYGHGPYFKNTPGMYLHKPLAISWPAEFYKPRYTLTDTARHYFDSRSTIDWEPNIRTDDNGRATVSFYAGEKPSTYTIIIEGTDFIGNLGYSLKKIAIKKKLINN